ncbi:MAG: hypothetical protein M3N43_13430 [Actinomycetota bacterium]|nr:hypothetical protein [Actinomycetota bacterium]
MSITIPLAVRLVTSRADRIVTRELRSLRFRSAAPGGFASASLSLDRPLSLQPDEIGYFGKLYVYDTRNGRTVWEGRVEDPARGNGSDGQVWQLVALGPSGHARDRRVPLIYVDRDMAKWERADIATPGATATLGEDPGTSTKKALILQWPQGLTVAVNSRAVMRYWQFMYASQKLARYDYTWDAGITAANCSVEAVTRTDGSVGSGEAARSQTFNVAGGGLLPKVITTDFPSGRNTVEARIFVSSGGGVLADDLHWASFMDLVVLGTRYSKAGAELTAGADYTTNTVLSSEVVADLLGRLLPLYDGTNATVATTSYAIEQLAYPDGVDAWAVLDDLMRLDAGYYWAAWESNSAGKYRFEWTAWPTSVRYEADVTDGFDSPGSADGLYNAVNVRWKDTLGRVRTNRRTQTVASLTAAGITREGLVDLGDDIGTSANADRAGDQWLAERASPPNAGRLTIARPIRDLVTGRMAMPWEIAPGQLVRVRGVLPRIDSLNATARDGVTIFRIVSVEYDTSSAAATLELDSYALSTARALATQAQRQPLPVRRR